MVDDRVLGGFRFVQGDETGPFLRDVHIRKNGLDRALRNTKCAVDALFRVDVEDLFALVEAVDRTHLDTVGIFAVVARFADHMSHWAKFSSQE